MARKQRAGVSAVPHGPPRSTQSVGLTFSGVYRLTPDLGTMTLLVEDFAIPNGRRNSSLMTPASGKWSINGGCAAALPLALTFANVASRTPARIGQGFR